MKRKYIRVLGVCACLGLFGLMNSCTGEEELGKYPSTWLSYTLSVDPTQLNVKAVNSTPTTLKVSSNTKWTVSANSSWVHLSTTNGIKDGTVDVTCDVNTSTSESRTSTIIFRYDDNDWDYTQVEVKQEPAIRATFEESKSKDIGRYSFTVENTYGSPYEIKECGVVYSATNAIPTIESGYVLKCNEVPEDDKTIQLTISNKIESGTIYYCRFYVVSPLGYEYSEAFQVLTEGKVPDISDNNKPQK